MTSETSVVSSYRAVLDRIVRAGGAPSMLVAVSKTCGQDRIRPVLDAGQRVFGENRVQEAMEKWPPLRAAFPDISLHLIGPLQTNKVREAVFFFDVIETVDRPKLALALAREMERQDKRPDCLIEINIGEETQKAGVAPKDALSFINFCKNDLDLPVKGLMCIPPAGVDPAPFFARMAALRQETALPVLSMGMSDDFPLAIEMGATHVRVGGAIFGARA